MDLQALLGDILVVAPEVAQPLRSTGGLKTFSNFAREWELVATGMFLYCTVPLDAAADGVCPELGLEIYDCN